MGWQILHFCKNWLLVFKRLPSAPRLAMMPRLVRPCPWGIFPVNSAFPAIVMPTVAPAQEPLLLSVVIPVYNEADNVLPLLAEIRAALAAIGDHEIIFVDDCSDDGTVGRLASETAETAPAGSGASEPASAVRVVRHTSRSGQSAAVRTGVRAARGIWIATLDGDGQN